MELLLQQTIQSRLNLNNLCPNINFSIIVLTRGSPGGVWWPRPCNAGFIVDKVALEQVYLRVFRFPYVAVILERTTPIHSRTAGLYTASVIDRTLSNILNGKYEVAVIMYNSNPLCIKCNLQYDQQKKINSAAND
jgi:hypothetical protein